MPPRTNPKLRPNLPRNPPSKLPRSPIIHRHHNHTTQSTPEERRNPLRAILPPQHHAFALRDAACFEVAGKSEGHRLHFAVSERFCAIPATLAVGTLVPVRMEIIEKEFCEGINHPDGVELNPATLA